MLFDSFIRKDLSRTFGATLLVLLSIVLTMFLIRLLGQAAGGRVSPQDVALLLGFTAVAHLPTLLALSLFVSTVATLTRYYRDSEMVIWFASGVGLKRFVTPVFQFAAPIWLLIAVMILWVWPWVNQQSETLKTRFEQRSDLSRITPGKFQSSRDGSKVFFIEKSLEEDGIGRNVFVLSRESGQEFIISAASGRMFHRDGDQYIELLGGQRNQQSDTGASSLARFEKLEMLTGEVKPALAKDMRPNTIPTLDLLSESTPQTRGELTWRLGLLLGAFNMTLLGMGLSATAPRRASNWNLLLALLGFIVYYNLINISQKWVSTEKMSAWAAMGWVHGLAFLWATALIVWRDDANRIVAVWRQPRRARMTEVSP